MLLSDISVGDIVRIRQWDDMAAEFGIDAWGDINCMHSFVPAMKYYCGLEGEVVSVDYESNLIGLGPVQRDINDCGVNFDDWSISSDMLEFVSDAGSYSASYEELSDEDLRSALNI